MNTLGTLCLVASLAILIFSIIQTSFGLWKKNERAIELGRLSLMGNFFLILLAFVILMTQLVRMDLSNQYVVMHSGENLPMFYRVTSIWSGSSGSLLFWNLLLNFFAFFALRETKNLSKERLPLLNLSLGVLTCFFSYLAVFYPDAQAFREFEPKAVVGRGLNPLLQHWAMIIHPPILYIGYVSFAIPFGVSMSALLSGKVSAEWHSQIRKWSLFSWFFLGVGILLGSKWAYEELGWGGYWAWDPVENASLMPWLLASAFIHSIIIEERRGMLKFWNMFLMILTFHFTLLGTWITRSGVLEGPHSFAKSTIGTPFIIYIGISFLVYTGILIYKREKFQPERNLEALTSKEGSFFLNNFLLVLACMVILLGVFSPLLYGKEFKSPWYNSWGIPAGIFLLLLMGASPLLAWRKAADSIFFTTLMKPTIFGIFCGLVYALIYGRIFTKTDFTMGDTLAEVYSVLTIALGGFTIGGIVQEFHRGVRARFQVHRSENYFVSAWNLIIGNKRRYGGYLVHFAIVLIFIGYAGNAFKQNTSFRFFYKLAEPKGDEIVYYGSDKAIIGNYIIESGTLKIKPFINDREGASPHLFNTIVTQEAIYNLKTNLNPAREMITERRFYPQISHLTGSFEAHIPTSEPDIFSTPKEDFYIQLGAIESPGFNENPDLAMLFMEYLFGTKSLQEKMIVSQKFPEEIIANLEIWVNPLVKFIWLGSLLFFLSGLFVLLPIGKKA
jgi:cytochrome c-type biogenesis protein CcmF